LGCVWRRGSCPSSLFDWTGGPSGGFDAPHAAYVSYKEGSGVGSLGAPPVVNDSCHQQVSENELRSAAENGGARVRFTFHLCQETAVSWETLLLGKTLYLKPGEALPEGSKEAFVALLEYAEEYLECGQILVSFRKDRVSRAMVRTFMFLGFTVLPPGFPKAPPGDFLSLLYTVDDTAEEDLYDVA